MTPDQLASSDSEHGHQRALMAVCNIASKYGWAAAYDDAAYAKGGKEYCDTVYGTANAVHALHVLHAIPNGGLRDKVQAARLKAEGVKAGVSDLFLPYPFVGQHGMYLEMKAEHGVLSRPQLVWLNTMLDLGYGVAVAYNWCSASHALQAYLSGGSLTSWQAWLSQRV